MLLFSVIQNRHFLNYSIIPKMRTQSGENNQKVFVYDSKDSRDRTLPTSPLLIQNVWKSFGLLSHQNICSMEHLFRMWCKRKEPSDLLLLLEALQQILAKQDYKRMMFDLFIEKDGSLKTFGIQNHYHQTLVEDILTMVIDNSLKANKEQDKKSRLEPQLHWLGQEQQSENQRSPSTFLSVTDQFQDKKMSLNLHESTPAPNPFWMESGLLHKVNINSNIEEGGMAQIPLFQAEASQDGEILNLHEPTPNPFDMESGSLNEVNENPNSAFRLNAQIPQFQTDQSQDYKVLNLPESTPIPLSVELGSPKTANELQDIVSRLKAQILFLLQEPQFQNQESTSTYQIPLSVESDSLIDHFIIFIRYIYQEYPYTEKTKKRSSIKLEQINNPHPLTDENNILIQLFICCRVIIAALFDVAFEHIKVDLDSENFNFIFVNAQSGKIYFINQTHLDYYFKRQTMYILNTRDLYTTQDALLDMNTLNLKFVDQSRDFEAWVVSINCISQTPLSYYKCLIQLSQWNPLEAACPQCGVQRKKNSWILDTVFSVLHSHLFKNRETHQISVGDNIKLFFNNLSLYVQVIGEPIEFITMDTFDDVYDPYECFSLLKRGYSVKKMLIEDEEAYYNEQLKFDYGQHLLSLMEQALLDDFDEQQNCIESINYQTNQENRQLKQKEKKSVEENYYSIANQYLMDMSSQIFKVSIYFISSSDLDYYFTIQKTNKTYNTEIQTTWDALFNMNTFNLKLSNQTQNFEPCFVSLNCLSETPLINDNCFIQLSQWNPLQVICPQCRRQIDRNSWILDPVYSVLHSHLFNNRESYEIQVGENINLFFQNLKLYLEVKKKPVEFMTMETFDDVFDPYECIRQLKKTYQVKKMLIEDQEAYQNQQHNLDQHLYSYMEQAIHEEVNEQQNLRRPNNQPQDFLQENLQLNAPKWGKEEQYVLEQPI